MGLSAIHVNKKILMPMTKSSNIHNLHLSINWTMFLLDFDSTPIHIVYLFILNII